MNKKDILALGIINAFTEPPKMHKEAEVKKENNFIGSKRLQKGHTLFEVNTLSGVISLAEYQTTDIILNMDNSTKKRKTVIVRENCIYVGALNVENVKKKLRREWSKMEKPF